VNALQLILSKQDAQDRWKLENTLNGKIGADTYLYRNSGRRRESPASGSQDARCAS
jgi:hypothetical protein